MDIGFLGEKACTFIRKSRDNVLITFIWGQVILESQATFCLYCALYRGDSGFKLVL